MNKEYKQKYKNNWKGTISREAWLANSKDLAKKIKIHQGNRMIDIDKILDLDKQDLENRFSIWKGR